MFGFDGITSDPTVGSPLENPPIIRLFKVEEDLPRFIRLRREIEAIDQAGTDTSETALRAELAWRGHDPEKDRWVVETANQPDIFLGYAAAFNPIPERYTVSIEVHPAWRRQKLGRALLAQVVSRARELGLEHLLIYAEATNEAANAFLRQNGLSVISDAWFMNAPATLSLSEPNWPEGYTVRSFAQV
jgi:ribosomal protein S18 acetylase RimI-like enzyme